MKMREDMVKIHTTDGRVYYLPFSLEPAGEYGEVVRVRVENYTDEPMLETLEIPKPVWDLLQMVQDYESEAEEDLCPVKAEILFRYDAIPEIWEMEWGGVYVFSNPPAILIN